MESRSASSAPIACSLSQQGLAERRRRWDSLAGRALAGVTDTPEGLQLRFAAEPGVEAELRDLAALERECCAFASWTVQARSGMVLLDVGGASPEAAAAVREMFAPRPD